MRKGRIAIIALTAALVLGIFSACGSSNSSEDANDEATEETSSSETQEADEQEAADQEAAEQEAAEQEAAEQEAAEQEAAEQEAAEQEAAKKKAESEWTVEENTWNFLDVSVVKGSKKSVTLQFECSSESKNSELTLDSFYSVTIGDDVYRVDDGSQNGFEGIPFKTKIGKKKYDYFVSTVEATPDKPTKMTISMIDGSKLPKTFSIGFDSIDTRHSAYKGSNVQDKYEGGVLTITRGA